MQDQSEYPMTEQDDATEMRYVIIDLTDEVKQIWLKLEQGLGALIESSRTRIGNIEESSQFRIMTYPYVDNELHIITPRSSTEGSHEENLVCLRYGNDTANYIMIMEISLFNKIPRCYINYFNIFRFIVDDLIITYHLTGYKGDLNRDDKVQPPYQLTGTVRSTAVEEVETIQATGYPGTQE